MNCNTTHYRANSSSVPGDPTDGFSAKVYQSQSGEIVISYGGTEFGGSVSGLITDFVAGNFPLAVGKNAEQALAAARLYQLVKADIAGGKIAGAGDITFAGHSLGGGLASLMAVWFDRPAYVFAPAPFQMSADVSQILLLATSKPALYQVKGLLAQDGPLDPALNEYDPIVDFAGRESRVQSFGVAGEVVGLIPLPRIEASRLELFQGASWGISYAITKHSIDLHVAGLLSESFENASSALPTALPRIFDGTLYGYGPMGVEQDFLLKLIRNQVGVVDIAPNGMLTHFAADLQKLGTNIAGLNQAAQDALTAQGIEWYYWQGTDYAGQEFFTQTGELLQYTTATGAGLQGAQNKALSYVNPWLDSYLTQSAVQNSSLTPGRPDYASFEQWNVAGGTYGVSASALDADKSQIFVGGSGGDVFTGGNVADIFFGGAGIDVLKGGGGDDTLYGGINDDVYVYETGDGSDTVIDSDGFGKIQFDTDVLSGGTKESGSNGAYVSQDGKYSYVWSGADLWSTA